LIFYFSVNPFRAGGTANRGDQKIQKQNEALNVGFHFLYVDINESAVL
jgi:hypothetical protein